MSQWDGLLSEAAQLSGVVVMGATNRRQALDPAVLRRFTLQYEVRQEHTSSSRQTAGARGVVVFPGSSGSGSARV